ncbi:MAG: nicotinamide mononucleotide transporter [Bacteroidetes bacterium]|nr:nicotinamide mononucleotide transporter [Bacteroidota bacterium]
MEEKLELIAFFDRHYRNLANHASKCMVLSCRIDQCEPIHGYFLRATFICGCHSANHVHHLTDLWLVQLETKRNNECQAWRKSSFAKRNSRILFAHTSLYLTPWRFTHHPHSCYFPWADSLATSTAFVAQYLVARKKLENWLLWMGVNLVYIAIYYHKDLHLYVILFSVYLILSFFGLYQWNKELKAQLASPNP